MAESPSSAPMQAAGYPPPGGYPPAGGPPPGGYGGPPGMPPGGPWGPPGGGYGGFPGGGFPGPPMPPPPPPQKGPNVGLFIGIGCAALFVLSAVGAGVAGYFVRRAASVPHASPTPTTPATPGSRSPLDDSDDTEIPAEATLRGEIRDLRNFRSGTNKAHYFVGEIHNTGTAPLGYPSAKVTFYDASHTALETSTCGTFVRVLPPGEKVACTFMLLKIDSWASYKAAVSPAKSLFKGQVAKLDTTDVKFTPKRGYSPHQLSGKITNQSPFRAKSVWALVSLYDAEGKIVGADQTLVAGKDLDPQASGLFSCSVYNVAATPETYRVRAIGYGD